MQKNLEKAIKLYHNALKNAPGVGAKASLYKNSTKAHELIISACGLDEEIKLYHFIKMIKKASKALKHGIAIHPPGWTA